MVMEIRAWRPGLIGQVAALHGTWYAREWDLPLRFEVEVARGLAGFAERFDEGRDGVWAACRGGRLAGFLALDAALAEGEGARLRWFIVDPEFRGQGIGARLFDLALGFALERGYPRLFLLTFSGLRSARRLYERRGFHLAQEALGASHGRELVEQRFELDLSGRG